MVKVGITGGIGSGKTAVCKIWQSLGAYILNADDLAKKIMSSNPQIKKEIQQTFGVESYQEDGSLNREYLAEQAFESGRVEELNRIVHPRIPGESQKIMEKAEKEGYDVFVYEAALLLQNVRPSNLDYIVLVLADREQRLQRVQQRDGSDREEILNRMKSQQNFEELKDKADIIIYNNGTLEALERRAVDVYRTFKN